RVAGLQMLDSTSRDYSLVVCRMFCFFFFFSSRRRHTRCYRDWSSDVYSSDLPVRWVACMQRAAELGGAGARFVEIGPGTVLAGLLKRSVPGATTVSLGTADEVARFLEAA